MDFTFSEEQREIGALAERVFRDRATAERVATAEATADRVDRDLWSTLADAGLLGVAVPEANGGAGLGLIEACLVLEQQGRRVAPVPLHPTAIATLLLAECGTADQRALLLPGVATGDVVLSPALTDPASRDPMAPTSVARPDGEGWLLSGSRWCVPAAHVATSLLVPATVDDRAVVFLVDPAAAGVTLERVETTSREVQPHVHLDRVRVDRAALLGGDIGAGPAVLRRLVDLALVGLCALQVGVCAEAVRQIAAYTAERKQFGRALATFQGVALRAADAYIDTEAMRVTLWQAAWRLAEGLDAEREVAVAKWWAADAGHRVVHAAQHLHGGLGSDVDYPLHRYFLWGKQLEVSLGGAAEQLSRLGARLARDASG